MEPTKTDADTICDHIDKLASQCKLNPTAYQREAKEKARTLERENAQLRKELEETNESLKRCSWIAKVADNEKAARLEAEQACDHFRTLAADNWKMAEELFSLIKKMDDDLKHNLPEYERLEGVTDALSRFQTQKAKQPK